MTLLPYVLETVAIIAVVSGLIMISLPLGLIGGGVGLYVVASGIQGRLQK